MPNMKTVSHMVQELWPRFIFFATDEVIDRRKRGAPDANFFEWPWVITGYCLFLSSGFKHGKLGVNCPKRRQQNVDYCSPDDWAALYIQLMYVHFDRYFIIWETFGTLIQSCFVNKRKCPFSDRLRKSRNGICRQHWKYMILFENMKWKE